MQPFGGPQSPACATASWPCGAFLAEETQVPVRLLCTGLILAGVVGVTLSPGS